MAINPANKPPIAPKSTHPGEIVHIRDNQKRNRTLCGTKLTNLVKAEPDCIVCLDILEYRRNEEVEG